MSDLFLRVRFWAKIVLFLVVGGYVLLFIWNNGQADADIWFLPFNPTYDSSVLVVILISLLFGAVLGILGRMLIFSGPQRRRLREKRRADELEREVRDMRRASAAKPGQP